MNKLTIFTLVTFLFLSGCSDSKMDPAVKRILNSADMHLIEIEADGPTEVYFIVTINGSAARADGPRRVTNTPFLLKDKAVVGIQEMAANRLGVFVSDGEPIAVKWILDDLSLGGSNSTSHDNTPYSGGPRILYHQNRNEEAGRHEIQVCMVTDPEETPIYDVKTNTIREI